MTTWTGPDESIYAKFSVSNNEVPILPYSQVLNDTTIDFCKQSVSGTAGIGSQCHFEVRTAMDCVIRHKTRKMGQIMNNIGT